MTALSALSLQSSHFVHQTHHLFNTVATWVTVWARDETRWLQKMRTAVRPRKLRGEQRIRRGRLEASSPGMRKCRTQNIHPLSFWEQTLQRHTQHPKAPVVSLSRSSSAALFQHIGIASTGHLHSWHIKMSNANYDERRLITNRVARSRALIPKPGDAVCIYMTQINLHEWGDWWGPVRTHATWVYLLLRG